MSDAPIARTHTPPTSTGNGGSGGATMTALDSGHDGAAARSVSGRSLVLIRWAAVAGQATGIVVVGVGLGYPLPLAPALLVVGLSVALNFVATVRGMPAAPLGEGRIGLFLAWDTIQLALLLGLTGGLGNPFALLLLAPVTVSASLLGARTTALLCAVVVAAATALAIWHLPLPWPAPGLTLPAVYVAGMWTAIVVGAGFIAAYVGFVTGEGRRMSRALAAAQQALAREQQLNAVGALAAAAAHELGSPLSTIVMTARELARETPPDGPMAEDLALLVSQSQRCRDILAALSRHPEDEGDTPYSVLPVTALVEAAAAPYEMPGKSLMVQQDSRPADGQAPYVRRSPEILHGLGNLVQNAMQFASGQVDVLVRWDSDTIEVSISDDGPGLAPEVLERLGEPYISTRRHSETGHMGLGVFIAQTLLGRTGGRLTIANRHDGGSGEGTGSGGTLARVRWPRRRLEPAAGTGDGRAGGDTPDTGHEARARGRGSETDGAAR
ncbi:MAG: ActS/PrrB/RegB family redox-sensitive histidine kinase [Alphaproteobacteria bacterium]